jgi:hypothetical protein
MYFRNFNDFIYDFEINGERKLTLVKDITQNVRIRTEILSNVTLYDEYDIVDGETPEIIAEKVYGSPEYHWVVMLCNLRFDWIADFPLTYTELDKFVTQKYGAGNENSTHHYIDDNGFEVDEDNSQATSVSNFQYEDAVNESKRRIKLISPQLLFKIINSFDQLI